MENSNNFIRLSNPPAMEVIFEVSTEENEDITSDALKITNEDLIKRFPNIESIEELTSQIGATDIATTRRPIGTRYKSKDNSETLNFSVKGYNYSKIGNYPGGDMFWDNIANTYKEYLNLKKNVQVSKLGLRCINVITIPNFNGNYDEFFNIYLNTPEELNPIRKSLLSYQKDFNQLECFSMVKFYMDHVKENNEAKFILDIDTIKENVSSSMNIEQLHECFEEMRECKNIVFFSSLKKEVVEQYK